MSERRPNAATLNDPAAVRVQYATEERLAARRAVYSSSTGADPREVAFAAIEEFGPIRVLEIGCGPGEATERVTRELGATVVAVDISPRMVDLAKRRGVDARAGDVQELDFGDESFDCALAAWVLFHAQDVDRAVGELARVLRRRGRLVAVTNGVGHLSEIWDLVRVERKPSVFNRENGEEVLRRHFATVSRRDADGTVAFPDAEAVRSYVRSWNNGDVYAERVPELAQPLVAHRRTTVFVADTA